MRQQTLVASLCALVVVVVAVLLAGSLGAAADTPSPVPALPAGSRLYGVWGSSANDVFVVGYDGANAALILHFDPAREAAGPGGAPWSIMNPGGSPHALNDVWGSSPSAPAQASSDVFAVGDFGTILHYNGTTWSPMSSGTSDQLVGVWGTGDVSGGTATDVFAVSNNGTILHYGGSVWSTMPGNANGFLYDVWGSSSHDVFAASGHGTILHYDGAAWSPMNSGASSNLLAVWGASGSDVFAVGGNGTILHYDPARDTAQQAAVLGAAGPGGSRWSPMNSGVQIKLDGIWGAPGSPPGNDSGTGGTGGVFVVGNLGTILHYDPAREATGPGGTTWSAMKSGTTDRLTAVWGSSGSDVYAVGEHATILHYDGKAWAVVRGRRLELDAHVGAAGAAVGSRARDGGAGGVAEWDRVAR
jgi:hypothetical protein